MLTQHEELRAAVRELAIVNEKIQILRRRYLISYPNLREVAEHIQKAAEEAEQAVVEAEQICKRLPADQPREAAVPQLVAEPAGDLTRGNILA